jgi:predicted transcriptional regulator of viral defense system
MNAASTLAHLRGLGKRVVTTNDVTLALGVERSAATHMLKRLAAEGLLRKIRHGLWAVDPALDPLLLPEYLTAPLPSYVSFQSALYLRGMVSQVPEVIYVASLAQTRRVKTTLGAFSIHRLAPTFFGGYETLRESGVRLASPEKALIDTLYLGPTRSRMFAHLPEEETVVIPACSAQ